jgi:hypothetical protein
MIYIRALNRGGLMGRHRTCRSFLEVWLLLFMRSREKLRHDVTIGRRW